MGHSVWRRRRNLIQNIAIALLSVSAVLLFAQLQLYNLDTREDSRYLDRLMGTLPADTPTELREFPAPVRVVLTDSYGRYGDLFSSTGGADFIVLSIKKLRPHLSLGKITFLMDLLVVSAGALLVSRSLDRLICGILVSFLLSRVMDKVLSGVSAGKLGLIITEQPRAVAEKIDALIGRGCTFLKAEGSYSRREKPIVLCACSSRQMFRIRDALKETEPSAFVIILDSNEVVGKGFSGR